MIHIRKNTNQSKTASGFLTYTNTKTIFIKNIFFILLKPQDKREIIQKKSLHYSIREKKHHNITSMTV